MQLQYEYAMIKIHWFNWQIVFVFLSQKLQQTAYLVIVHVAPPHDEAGVLPVVVHAVQLVLVQELLQPLDELASSLGVSHLKEAHF